MDSVFALQSEGCELDPWRVNTCFDDCEGPLPIGA